MFLCLHFLLYFSHRGLKGDSYNKTTKDWWWLNRTRKLAIDVTISCALILSRLTGGRALRNLVLVITYTVHCIDIYLHRRQYLPLLPLMSVPPSKLVSTSTAVDVCTSNEIGVYLHCRWCLYFLWNWCLLPLPLILKLVAISTAVDVCTSYEIGVYLHCRWCLLQQPSMSNYADTDVCLHWRWCLSPSAWMSTTVA